jgi:hypothetical protein
MSDDSPRSPSRRRLFRTASGAAAALSLGRAAEAQPERPAASPEVPPRRGETMIGVPFERRERVRLGLIGCGNRGNTLLQDLLHIPGVEVLAVCDNVPEKVSRAQATVEKAGGRRPEGYARGDHDFENLCRRGDLDLVYVASPWRWHVPMATAAMRGGAHVGVEVPPAVTLEECWALVDTSEATRRHCAILENCCYGWSELLVRSMVKAGVFGELTHAECAYIHDLRRVELFKTEGEGLWRRAEHVSRNGNLYPTHGLGPIALDMDIQRGDRFLRLVSMSSPSLGLQVHRDRTLAPDDPRRRESYVCGDMNSSLIQTARGRTILLQHDVISPRPYSRINLVSGTLATFADYPPRIFFDPASPHAPAPRRRRGREEDHDWLAVEQKRKRRRKDGIENRFEHPLWTRLERQAKDSGHGGMDYVMSWRLVQCVREGLVPDLDVYDAAAWSAPSALSEASVASGSGPVDFPDFTRGLWDRRRG